MAGPLSGIRVVELGQVIAGPFCGPLLGDYGAEVIKNEPPGTGDVLRQRGKGDGTGDSLWWSVADERHGELAIPAIVPKLSVTPGEIRWTGRPLGADTDAVLTEVLGMTAEQIEELRVRGVLGQAGGAL